MDNRPLRILAIGSSQSTHVINRVRCFADRGHKVFLLCESAAGIDNITDLIPAVRSGRDEWVADMARRVSRLFGKSSANGADMARLMLDFRRLVRDAQPDVVHVHYAYATWAWMAAVIGVRPLVVSIMGGDVLYDEQGSPTPQGIALTKNLLRHANLITAKSSYLIKVLDSLGGYGAKAMRVVWGVDPAVFRPVDAAKLRAELGLPVNARVVLSPKILQPFYNIDVVVDAMARVVAGEPHAHLVVTEYGADETYKAALISQIQSCGIERQVTFVGRIAQERMPLFYSLAEVVVGIPKSDGLPQTLVEAMACGAPNVIGRLDRYGEIVKDGESAVFAELDPQSVAGAILSLFRDESLRRRIATAGRRIVVEQANFPKDVDRVEQAYYGLSRRRSPIQVPSPRMLAGVARYWLGQRT